MTESRSFEPASVVVDPGHPGVRIELLDRRFTLAAEGIGRLEVGNLRPGFYKIRYRAAEALEERFIDLHPGLNPTVDHSPDLPFAAPAPLTGTWTSHEYHQAAAIELAQAAPTELGRGASLLVLGRDIDPQPERLDLGALSLHHQDGRLVVALGEVARLSEGSDDHAGWAGCHLALDPGSYRLRQQMAQGPAVEMSLHLAPGWRHQVFLLRRADGARGRTLVTFDLASATQLMTQHSFDPGTPRRRVGAQEAAGDARLAELARRGLEEGRETVSRDALGSLLDAKWFDPLFGILALHLMLMGKAVDLDLAQRVHGRLESQILGGFSHPDVQALGIEIARRRGTAWPEGTVDGPPMLRRSWAMLVSASAERPDLIPATSLAGRIGERIWGGGAWLVWRVPPAAAHAKAMPAASLLASAGQGGPGFQIGLNEVVIGDFSVPIEDMDNGGGRPGFDIVPLLRASTAPSSVGERLRTLATAAIDRIGLDKVVLPTGVGELLGRRPDAWRELTTRLRGFDTERLGEILIALLPKLERLLQWLGTDRLIERARLDNAEAGLLLYLESLVRRSRRARKDEATPEPRLDFRELVAEIGMPASTVREAMVGLAGKLVALAIKER